MPHVASHAAARTANAVRLVRAIGAAKRRRKMPRKIPPRAIEREYARALSELTTSAIIPGLLDILRALPALVDAARVASRGDAFRRDAGEVKRLVDAAYAKIIAALPVREIANLAMRFAAQISAHNRRQLSRQLVAVLGVEVAIPDTRTPRALEAFVDQNVALVLDNVERFIGNVEKDITRILAGARIDAVDAPGDPRRQAQSLPARANVALIKRAPADLDRRALAEAITRNVALGGSTRQLAEELRDRFDFARGHAELIARDQVGKLNGQLDAQRQQGLGVSRFIWRTVGDERVREEHEERDGEIYSYDDPPDGEIPGEPVNCFPGETPVSSASPINVLYRRWYRGEGAVLVTEDGRRLRSTPNHPIFTLRGWKAAKDIEVGDHVVETCSESVDAFVSNREHGDPMIEEIFRALLPLGCVHTRTGFGGWFHGDGTNEQVDVVDVNRSLRLEIDPELGQSFCDQLLARAYDFRLASGNLSLLFGRPHPSAHRFVRGSGQLLSLLLGCGPHANEHRSRTISWLDSITNELRTNGCAGDAVTFRDALHAPPVGVEPAHHAARIIYGIGRRSVDRSSRRDTPSAEILAEVVGADVQNSRRLRERIGGHHLRRVVEKSRCELSCSVFNFGTASGWYVAHGLIVSNCRCSAEPLLSDILDEL